MEEEEGGGGGGWGLFMVAAHPSAIGRERT